MYERLSRNPVISRNRDDRSEITRIAAHLAYIGPTAGEECLHGQLSFPGERVLATRPIHFLSYFTFALGVRKVKAFTAVGPQDAFLRQKATAQRITYASQCSRLAPLTECTDPKFATRVAFYDRTRRPLNTGTRVSALKLSGIEGPSHNHLMSLQIHTPILFGVDEQRGRSDVTLVQAREMLA